jgi:outer membrane protein insertion porin family
MFLFLVKLFLMLFLFTTPSLSKNYNEIIINGNSRISDETIKVFSKIPDNKTLDENSINLILKNLYNTFFFKDISVKIDNNQLVIDVEENPIIQSVFVEGVKAKKIKESITEILSLKDRSSFNNYQLNADKINITNTLKNRGYYFSTLTSEIEDLGDNKINLIHRINIGNKSKISKISFLGDKKIKDRTLKALILSEEYKFWKFLSGKKYLNEQLITFDQKLLNNFYKNLGYYNVKIESSYAKYIGNDKFELIYNITSGKKFFFNDLKIILPPDYDDENFINLNKIFTKLKGKSYSLNSVDNVLKEIDKIVLNKEYEFLNATVDEELNDNLINLVFNIRETERFYVEKINIFGNNITHEEVIRDTLSVDEGDSFNELLHTKSINNIKSLNFFRQVKSDILNGTNNNQKIINITVEEKPTGEISAGAGVGTSGGTLSFSAKENNFLGKGIEFGSNLTLNKNSIRGLFSVDNPNYKGSNRSLSFTAQSSAIDRLTNSGYKSNKTGFSIGSGIELYEDLVLNTGISSYFENIKTDSTASASMISQKGSYFDTFFNYTLDYDKRNQKFKTTDGFRSRFTQNLPIISDNYTLTNRYDYKVFNTWLKENIASISFYASTTNSLTNKDVKLSDRISLPSSRLRGFELGKVGPKDGDDFIGGNYATAISFGTTMPQILPTFENTDFSIFLDAANVWGVDYDSNLNDGSSIRSSIGLAIDLFTVIGPLNFSFTEVISKANDDISESFRFNLGTTF